MVLYFFVRRQGPPEDAGYQHCLVALGEGLQELGVPFFSNDNYWRRNDGWLFRQDPEVRPQDCDAIITSNEYERVGSLPDGLFGGSRQTVFIDSSDGWRTRTESPYYRRFDFVLRAHYNEHYRYPANIRPWAFGLTERIIDACGSVPPFDSREKRMVFAFRVGQPVRRAAAEIVLPQITSRFPVSPDIDEPPAAGSGEGRAYWEATGRRHYPSYYARLRRSMACAAFGGYFAPGVWKSTESLPERALYHLAWRLGRKSGTVMQFDNWRFWESMAAGCLTLQVDFHLYGCRLPTMPKHGVHYAGFDFSKSDCTVWIRTTGLDDLASVADAGRSWALEHYSPVATAKRLLRMLDGRD